MSRVAQLSLPIGLGLLVGVAVTAAPGTLVTLALALALGLGASYAGEAVVRVRRGLVLALVAFSIVVVHRVLSRGGWHEEADALTRFGAALLAGAGASFAVSRWTSAFAASRPIAALVAGALSVVVGARLLLVPKAAALPGWPRIVAELGSDPARSTHRDWVALERLRAAGFRDAAWARVTLLVEHGAELEVVRAACPTGHRRAGIGGAWGAHVLRGRAICDALRTWPEDAASSLATLGDEPAASRLRGDVLMDAGRVGEAMNAYREGAARDHAALLSGTRQLLARGRAAEAAELAAPLQGPAAATAAVWLDSAGHPTPGASEEAWNALLRFDGYAGPSRRGLSLRGKGRALVLADPARPLLNLTIATPNSVEFTVGLPLPPRRAVPRTIEMSIRNRRAYRLGMLSSTGVRHGWGCGNWRLTPDEIYTELAADACSGWATVRIEPPPIPGEVVAFELAGVYSLEYIRLSGAHGP